MTRKSKCAIVVASLLSLGLVAVGAVLAATDSGRGGMRMGAIREVLASLDLTAEQKADIKEILKGQRPVMEPLRDQVVAARRDLFEAIHAPDLDEGGVRAASDRLARAQTAMAIERARTVARVRELLTDEQRKTLDGARAKGIERAERRGRHGRRMLRDRGDELIDSF